MTSIDFDVRYNPQVILQKVVEVEAFKRSVLKLPLPYHFAQEFESVEVARNIRGTAAIEGNPLSEHEVEELVKSGVPERTPTKAEKEILNLHEVQSHLKQLPPNSPITETLIQRIHGLITEGIDYPNNVPGEYRHHRATVGMPVYYPPPTNEEIKALMREYVDFLNSRRFTAQNPAIRAVLAHYFLVLIHPFGDGNGRTARAIEALILYQNGCNVRGFYSLANYYYQHRERYFRLLSETRLEYQSDQTALLSFALGGFAQELERVQERIVRLFKRLLFRDYINVLERERRINERQRLILEGLMQDERETFAPTEYTAHPVVQATYRTYKRGVRSVRKDFRSMATLNLLKFTWDDPTVRRQWRVSINFDAAEQALERTHPNGVVEQWVKLLRI